MAMMIASSTIFDLLAVLCLGGAILLTIRLLMRR
jgi:hypothetical protein